MSAFLKVYTDVTHLSEVAHTTAVATTLNGSVTAGATSLVVNSTTNWPAQGAIDIIDGVNGNETIAYSSFSGTTVNLTSALAFNHPNATTVNQWVYQLAIGDQTNGILNDGSQASPTGSNTGSWYCYNAGDQVAQSPTLSTSNASPSTSAGFSDTKLSITSANSGFATSVSPSNINAGSQVQFWAVAEVPTGQSSVSNPQLCVLNLGYQTV